MKKVLIVCLSMAIPTAAYSADLAKGKDLYAARCATCHGAEGKGDGPVAGSLPADQKPRNFVEAKYKYTTDDAKFKELLQKGGPAFGMSPLMAAQPMSDDDAANVIAYVHSLKK